MNWQQLAPLIIILALSGISFIFRKLQEKAEQKAKLERIEQARDRAIREGRDPRTVGTATTESPAQPTLREIAERRRLELEARRQATLGAPPRPAPPQGRATARPPRPASPGTTAQPRPSMRPQPAARPPARPRGPVPIAPGTSARPTPRKQERRTSAPPARRPEQELAHSEAASGEVHRLVTDDAIPAPAPKAGGFARRRGAAIIGVVGPGDLLRAIVMQEVLGPPLCKRDRPHVPGW